MRKEKRQFPEVFHSLDYWKDRIAKEVREPYRKEHFIAHQTEWILNQDGYTPSDRIKAIKTIIEAFREGVDVICTHY